MFYNSLYTYIWCRKDGKQRRWNTLLSFETKRATKKDNDHIPRITYNQLHEPHHRKSNHTTPQEKTIIDMLPGYTFDLTENGGTMMAADWDFL